MAKFIKVVSIIEKVKEYFNFKRELMFIYTLTFVFIYFGKYTASLTTFVDTR